MLVIRISNNLHHWEPDWETQITQRSGTLLKNVDDYQIKKFVNEAIKCHHNEIADYFLDKLENHDEIKSYLHKRIIRYHNYQYLNGTENWSNYADLFIENNYVSIVKTILNNFEDDIDKTLQRYEEKGCKTFLSLAIENENIEIVKYLINDLNASTSYFATDFLYDSTEFCTNKTLLYLAVERIYIIVFQIQKNSIMIKTIIANIFSLKRMQKMQMHITIKLSL